MKPYIILLLSFISVFYSCDGFEFPFTFKFTEENPWSNRRQYAPQMQMQMPNFEIPEIPEAEMMTEEENDAENMMGNEENDFLSDFRMPEKFIQQMRNLKNVSSKNTTTEKDGYTVKMYNQSGPGFISFVEEVVSKPNNKTNATKGMFQSAKMFGGKSFGGKSFGAKMFPGWKMLAMPINAANGRQCHRRKNCKQNEFCDPETRMCTEQLKEGGLCGGKNQCAKDLVCVWGKCQCNKNFKEGDIGTFCKNHSDCNNNGYCNHDPRRLQPVCSPRIQEGMPCEEIGLLDLLTSMSQEPRNAPCEQGLKCSYVGDDGRFKLCTKDSYVEKVGNSNSSCKNSSASENESSGDEEESDTSNNNSNASSDDNEDKSDGESSDSNDEDENKPIPIQTEPSKKKGSKKNKNKNRKSHSKKQKKL